MMELSEKNNLKGIKVVSEKKSFDNGYDKFDDETSPLNHQNKDGNVEESHDSSSRGEIRFLRFINLTNLDRTHQFAILATCHVICAMVFAALQEEAFLLMGHKAKEYAQTVTLGTQIMYVICSSIELLLDGRFTVKTPLWKYGCLSILTTAGMYFTNSSLAYLSYPTRIIFKSAKPIPTMAVEVVYPPRKTFSTLEITAIFLLTIGITLFSYGEVIGVPNFSFMGVLLVSIGTVADAFTSNYEKKNIFKPHDASHAEVMCFASFFGIFWTILSMYGTFFDQMNFLHDNPEIASWIALSSIGGYFSVSFVLLLIKSAGPTYAEVVKGFRKAFSIAFSYLIYPTPDKNFGYFHMAGVMFFMASIANTVWAKSKKSVKH